MDYVNTYRERKVADRLETLSNEFQFISDIETKCENIKARIDMIKDRVGYEDVVITKPPTPKIEQKQDLGDIRNKLKPKPNSIQEEMQQADAELDRALKKALAMN